MAVAFRDVERLLDGPIEFTRDWRARERRRRNQALRFVLWAAAASVYVSAMRLHGLHSVPLGPLLAGVYAVVPIAGVVRETAGNAHFILTWAASFCVGVVATMGLRYGLDSRHLIAYLGIPATFVTLIGVSLTASFTGWCAAIPDRDIAVRRAWDIDRLLDVVFVRGVLTPRERLAVLSLMGGIAGSMLIVTACDYLAARDRVAALMLLVVVPALYGAAASLACGVPLRLVFSSTWRMIVGFLTYDRSADGSRPDALGYYRFPGPLRDHRLRALMLSTLVVAASVGVVSALDWPQPLTLSADLSSVLDSGRGYQAVVASAVVLAFRVAALTAALLFAVFIIIAGWFGTFAAFTYREFAERAVTHAERASR